MDHRHAHPRVQNIGGEGGKVGCKPDCVVEKISNPMIKKNASNKISSDKTGSLHPKQKFLYTNARSRSNKMKEMQFMLVQEDFDFMVISETWLDSLQDWAVNVHGYNLFRRDRMDRRRLGLSLY